MDITVVIMVNAALSLLAMLGLAGVGLLAHRLPSSARIEDQQAGLGRASYPLGQIMRDEAERQPEFTRAN